MINWRKPLIYVLSFLQGSKRMKYYKEILKIAEFNPKEKQKLQEEKLEKLLLYSYKNVPYYTKVLTECGAIKDEKVKLENFHKIPILTKDIIRREGENMYSIESLRRGSYKNTSGGSTGEPIVLLQDKEYDDWNVATKMYYFKKHGKDIGQREIKLWGSDRDILQGNLELKDRLINFLYSRRFYNCYDFSEKNMMLLVEMNNRYKPISYWAYVDGIYEFSKFVLENNIKLHSPKLIISTIGPLYDEMREVIERAFGCKVYNQYGSREVGGISVEEDGLMEVSFWRQILELQGESLEKRIVLTCLDNYSMPLIRYDIGDVATAGMESCNVGGVESFLNTGMVVGRTLGFFKKRDGSLKHSHFLVQQLFFRDWIGKFQAIQTEYENILIKVVGIENKKEMIEVEGKIKVLMGEEFNIKWEFVNDIKPSSSGKYLYTICEVS